MHLDYGGVTVKEERNIFLKICRFDHWYQAKGILRAS